MSNDGPSEVKGPDVTQEYLMNVLTGSSDDLTPQAKALILVQNCQTKTKEGTKIHDPTQVLALIAEAVHNTQGKDGPETQSKRAEVLENAREVLDQLIQMNTQSYDGLTKEGTKLNGTYRDMLQSIADDTKPQTAVNVNKDITLMNDNHHAIKANAKNREQDHMVNKSGTDVKGWVSSLRERRVIGGYRKDTFKNMAKDIATDLKNYQVNTAASHGVDEVEINKHAAFFNGISGKVADDILQSKNEQEATNVARLYIETARQSIKAGDYDSAVAIVAGLNNNNVDRLKGVFENLPTKSQNHLQELNDLVTPARMYHNLKEHMNAREDTIVYPSPLVLVPLTQGGEMPKINADQTFNTDRAEMLAKSVMPLQEQREKMFLSNTERPPTPPKTNFIQDVFNGPKLTAEQQDILSSHIKGRPGSDKGTAYDGSQFATLPKIDDAQPDPKLTAQLPGNEPNLELEDPDPDEIEIQADDVEIQLAEPADQQEYKDAAKLEFGEIDPPVPPLDLGQVERQDDPAPQIEREVEVIGPGVGERQRIGADKPVPVVPKLDLDKVPKNLDLDQVPRVPDPSPQIKREGPDAEGLKEAQKQERKEQRKHDEGGHRKHHHKHDDGGHRKHHHHKKRRHKKPHDDQGGQTAGKPQHMTSQYANMLQRQKDKSEQEVSPVLQQKAEQRQEQEAPKQESPRGPRGGIGGLTAMWQARIDQAKQDEKGPKQEGPKQEGPKQNDSSNRRKLK